MLWMNLIGWNRDWLFHLVILFCLVLARVGAMVMATPILRSQAIPFRIRGLFAVGVAGLLTPLFISVPITDPTTIVDASIMLASEGVIGLSLGLGLQILFSGIQIAGQVIGQMSGMALADVFNPGIDETVPLFSNMLFYVSMAIFVIIGGHRIMIESLMETFQEIPPGSEGIFYSINSLADAILMALRESFVLGLRASAPVMVSLFMTTVVLGLITRTMPQFNVLAIGFGVNAYVTLAALSLTLGAMAWVFQEQVEPTLRHLVDGVVQAGSSLNTR